MADVPISIRLLRLKLGRAGLLESSKIAIVQALDDEVPSIPGVIFYGWVLRSREKWSEIDGEGPSSS
jgi:hypothetical protein